MSDPALLHIRDRLSDRFRIIDRSAHSNPGTWAEAALELVRVEQVIALQRIADALENREVPK